MVLLVMKKNGEETYSDLTRRNELPYFRSILLAGALAYVLFGLVYNVYLPGDFPMSIKQRICASAFFLVILAGTYLSRWARENVVFLMYLAASGAFFHLIYFSYANNYSLNYALSVLVVIIVINFLFRGDLKLIWFNAAMDAGVGASLFLVPDPGFNRTIFLSSAVIISTVSFFLSNSRQKAREEYEKLFHGSPVGLAQCDLDGNIEVFNRQMLKLAGNPPEEKLNGLNLFELLGLDRNELRSVKNEEDQITFPWGEEVWIDYSVEPIPEGSEKPREIVLACKNITKRKTAEDKIEYVTFHDDLTNLYNRSFFQKNAERLASEEFYPLSAIFIDVDKLKLTNDAFGHQVGDKLLNKASDVIENSCRGEDLIFRWGGDEIVVLLPKTNKEEAGKVFDRIKRNADEAEFKPIGLNLSLGIATEENYVEGLGTDHVLRKAEERMYENKMEKQEEITREILKTISDRLKDKSGVIDHSERVEKLAVKLGKKLDLSENQLEKVALTARYHDIGKVFMKKRLLESDFEELAEQKEQRLKDHPETGHQILKELHGLEKAARPVLYHHEWWNGEGFPRGINGEEIPYISRIVSVVNVYDFLRHPLENTREKMTEEEALQKLKKRSGSQFDPAIVEAFVEMKNK